MTGFTTLLRELEELEIEHGLYGLVERGVHLWDHLRLRVHYRLLRAHPEIAEPHTTPPRGLAGDGRRAARYIWNSARANPFLASRADLMVVGQPRRKLEADGTWWDLYVDPILPHVDASSACFEMAYQARHLTPPRTGGLRHLDIVPVLGRIAGARERATLRPETARTLARVESRLRERSGVDIDLVAEARVVMRRHQGELPFYRRIVRRVQPKVLLLVVSYGKETLIEAAHDEGVTVLELQHGNLGAHHPGYSFARGHKHAFPDRFLSFGDHWNRLAAMPVKANDIRSVGYAYFDLARARELQTERREQILVLSQGIVGPALSRLALELAQAYPGEVVLKLHPGEYGRWRGAYPWLAGSRVRCVEGDDPPLYQLMAQSRAQVGVYSTALFEGLGFGLPTFIADLPGADAAQHLVDAGGATVARSADDIVAALDRPRSVDITRFFRPHAAMNARREITSVLGR